MNVFAELANRLIDLAIRFANLALLGVIAAAPLAGADAEGVFERPRKGVRARETAVEGNFSNGLFGIVNELGGRLLHTYTLDKLVEGFTHNGPEKAMKMKRREIGDTGQGFELQGSIEIEIDVVNNAVDAGHVFLSQILAAFVLRSHSVLLSANCYNVKNLRRGIDHNPSF